MVMFLALPAHHLLSDECKERGVSERELGCSANQSSMPSHSGVMRRFSREELHAFQQGVMPVNWQTALLRRALELFERDHIHTSTFFLLSYVAFDSPIRNCL